jgi:hypothetical protein
MISERLLLRLLSSSGEAAASPAYFFQSTCGLPLVQLSYFLLLICFLSYLQYPSFLLLYRLSFISDVNKKNRNWDKKIDYGRVNLFEFSQYRV